MTADGGGFRFDHEAPLRRGVAVFFFLVKLAHTKYHNGPFFRFLPRSRTKRAPNFGLESLLLSKYNFSRYHNEALHFVGVELL